MTVFLDPPAWPAHGTLFSHLVSDTSLEELHDLAEHAGCHPRAFDRDHYDVPERLYASCLDAGAVPAPTRRLVRALRQGGLRRTKAQVKAEQAALTDDLLGRWPLPDRETARDLIARWQGPRRYYHDARHLAGCLDALDQLGGADRPVRLAAWFHDAVYLGRPDDEEASAKLAETYLYGLVPHAEIAEVARLVRLTAGHSPTPGDATGELLCDADLSILGSEPDRYAEYLREVRREYADVPLIDFRRGRLDVVRQLAALEPIYRTETGAARWADRAARNLGAEQERLTAVLAAEA